MTAAVLIAVQVAFGQAGAGDWPRWRGPDGNAVSNDSHPPLRWSQTENVPWRVAVPGEGFSSPIVWRDRVFLTSAADHGSRRSVHCINRRDGRLVWTGTVSDNDPERTSAMTGHAAATPATDGRHVVASFGNAGIVCYDFDGRLVWHHRFGPFDSELGLASSPVIHRDRVFLVCDHDGDRFSSFDSFLVALDVRTGEIIWKTDRPELFRSWSTPVLVPVGDRFELVVSAQDELRGYDPESGELLWRVSGQTGWVAPSPVFGRELVFACSGKDGPSLAVRPGGRGDVTASHVAWKNPRGAPYVCSPLVYGEQLFVIHEGGVLTCLDARTGSALYRQRLEGKFTASPVAARGCVYVTNEAGTTFVLRAGPSFELVARNALDEYCLASPALAGSELFLRTEKFLYCIRE